MKKTTVVQFGSLVLLAALTQLVHADNANNFSDPLTLGNQTNFLSFDVANKYAYTPVGLVRAQSSSAIDRPMVRTVASNFNEADSFVAEIDIQGSDAVLGDLIWFGFGPGLPSDVHNEPSGFIFRIHAGDFQGSANAVDSAVKLPGGGWNPIENMKPNWPQGSTRFRIEKNGSDITLSFIDLSNQVTSKTYPIGNFFNGLNSGNSHFFFGNTHAGTTVFSNLTISSIFPSVDEDGDGVNDDEDACPGTPEGTVVDSAGCPVVLDSDGDGVDDDHDLCPATPEGSIITALGCSGAQAIALVCPATEEYKNHGQYVSCVAHAAEDAVLAGLLTDEEADAIVSAAAQSAIGKPAKAGKKK